MGPMQRAIKTRANNSVSEVSPLTSHHGLCRWTPLGALPIALLEVCATALAIVWVCQWRMQDFIMQGVQQGPKSWAVRPKGPKARLGVLGRGNELPSHQLDGLGSTVSSPSGVSGGSRGRQTVFLYFKCTGWRLLLDSRSFLH